MTGRQRQLAAIRHEVPDRIPLDWISIDDPTPIGREIGTDDVDRQLGRDGRSTCIGEYTGPVVAGRDDKTLDIWGRGTQDDYGTSRVYPLASASSVGDIQRYPFPDGAAFRDAATVRQAVLRDWNRQYAVRGPYWASAPLFCTACSLFGMEEAMVKMIAEPEVFEACVDRVFDFSYSYVNTFIDAMGDALDILYLADDFASQRGLMIDPASWRRIFKPRYARLFELGKKHDMPVWFHSCGDITPVLGDLVDIGMDVWETVQLHALPMSPQELKRQYGRQVTFFGGIATQRLPFAMPQAVRDEVRAVCEALGEGGGFICGPDHHIKPDVPAANTIALFNEAASFRKPGYTL